MILRIIILDLGLNNINSVRKAFVENSAPDDSVEVISENINLHSPALIVLPGLGKFAAAMEVLCKNQFDELIKENKILNGCVVGICLGMQLLMSESEESPGVKGLGLIPGAVRRLNPNNKERVPNIGWNSTVVANIDQTFLSLRDGKDYYFVHSYFVETDYPRNVLACSPYGTGFFTSAIIDERILGVQFHPEKSSGPGALLIKEIIEWARNEV